MKRRAFIHQSSLFSASLMLANGSGFTLKNKSIPIAFRYLASSSTFPKISVPDKKRIPLGWKSMPVTEGDNEEATLLKFDTPNPKAFTSPIYLRITAALDFREEKMIRAYLPESGLELGRFVIKYAHPFQPFEIPIEKKHLKKILKQGIALSMIKGSKDAWFFREDADQVNNQGLQPHLLSGKSKDKLKAFKQNLYSMNSFSPFGWMGGCVQDALYELHLQGDKQATHTLSMQLSKYLDNEQGIIFENPHTIPLDGTFNSIEDFLPLAAIAGLYPDHISIEKGINFMLAHKQEDGMILNGHITTEGCYTLAYPLAALAVIRKDESLAQVALDQLSSRMNFLSDTSEAAPAIYQRCDQEGNKAYRNWGRGVAWYVLGTIKTYHLLHAQGYVLSEELREIGSSFTHHISWIAKLQNQEGLWYAYLDRPETGIDTSASGGIAAAIAWGCYDGLLDKEKYLPIAEKAYTALQEHLSEDGFLRDITQINRGGEALQANNYRVISQFGMGLMAQLQAAMNIQ